MSPPDAQPAVLLESLPIAALLVRDGRAAHANAAYTELMRVPAEAVVGQSVEAMIARFVVPDDRRLIEGTRRDHEAGEAPDGWVYSTVVDGEGRARLLLVRWQILPSGDTVVYLVDRDADARARRLSERLARAGAELVRCATEREVLDAAADALHAEGWTVTILCIVPGDDRLAYGAVRAPRDDPRCAARVDTSLDALRPPTSTLRAIHPGFDERRAAFVQDMPRLLREIYPADVAEALIAELPARRAVQVPLYVSDEPFGSLGVTSDELTPVLAAAVEVFGALVERALENVRLRAGLERRLAELERLQSELLERERLAALGEAAGVMAHEVRNPIAAILNATAILRRNSGTLEEMVRVIGEEAARLERLVRDLLDLGRPMLPRLRPTDLHELARASAALLREREERDAARVVVRAVHGAVSAHVDPDLVQLALLNVVRNALQASPAGSTVTIEVGATDAEVTLAVVDEGPGFLPEVASRAFEPFFTTRASGTGLGLALVRRVMRAHEGSVSIAPRTRGAQVVLGFPRATSRSPSP